MAQMTRYTCYQCAHTRESIGRARVRILTCPACGDETIHKKVIT